MKETEIGKAINNLAIYFNDKGFVFGVAYDDDEYDDDLFSIEIYNSLADYYLPLKLSIKQANSDEREAYFESLKFVIPLVDFMQRAKEREAERDLVKKEEKERDDLIAKNKIKVEIASLLLSLFGLGIIMLSIIF